MGVVLVNHHQWGDNTRTGSKSAADRRTGRPRSSRHTRTNQHRVSRSVRVRQTKLGFQRDRRTIDVNVHNVMLFAAVVKIISGRYVRSELTPNSVKRTGECSSHQASVIVIAPTATLIVSPEPTVLDEVTGVWNKRFPDEAASQIPI